jgi:hypothetical protein
MKKVFSSLVCVAASLALVGWLNTEAVQAFPEFRKEFEKKYVPENPNTPAEKSLKAEFDGAKCGICHLGPQGKEKKKRNAYGMALSKLIKKEDKKDSDKIQGALDTVAKEPSVAGDASSPSYGDLIKEGKLPVPTDK